MSNSLWIHGLYSLLGSCFHGILQARILEWVVISFSKGSSLPRDQIHVSCIGKWILYHWATWDSAYIYIYIYIYIYTHTHTYTHTHIYKYITLIINNVYLSVFINISISSVAQSCPTLCNPMNRSTPGLPVHHQLPESTQTHVHWVGDAIQPFHPPLSPSLLASNLSQSFPMSQLFASGGQSIGASASTSVLPMNTQDWSPLGWTGYTQFNM